MDGFRGLISLVDQAGGDAMTITLWESEDAMRATEAKADEMRRQMADSAGHLAVSRRPSIGRSSARRTLNEIRGVERYED